jgi:hypothetical protein
MRTAVLRTEFHDSDPKDILLIVIKMFLKVDGLKAVGLLYNVRTLM